VILIALSLSWVSSITVTPLLSYLLFKPTAAAPPPASRTEGEGGGGEGAGGAPGRGDPYAGLPLRIYRNLLAPALRFRWPAVAASAAGLAAGLYGFTKVDQSFFPPATRPQFMVDVFLPAGTHIRETESFADAVGRHIRARPGVTHVTSFVG